MIFGSAHSTSSALTLKHRRLHRRLSNTAASTTYGEELSAPRPHWKKPNPRRET